MTDAAATPIVIKRYGDRLYLAADARYVSLAELRRMIDGGAAFVVVDAETGADVTDMVSTEGLDRSAAGDRWRATVDALEALVLADRESTDSAATEPDPTDDIRRLIAVRIGAAGLPPSPTARLPTWWQRRGSTAPAALPPAEPSPDVETEPEPPVSPNRPRWRDGPRRD
jgi:hypothetical protein